MASPGDPLLITLLLFTACILSLIVLASVATTFTTAYFAAASEISTFIDAVDFSIQENESYDRDVAKVSRLEDKLRLGKLLREIQKCGDDFREDLNKLVIEEGGTRLRSSTRLLWAAKRKRLETCMRRLDMLRMRFLVVYMGLIAAQSTAEITTPLRESEKSGLGGYAAPKMQIRPGMAHALTEGIKRGPPPLRRITTQAMGHNDKSSGPQKMGWAGVVAELQKSPKMHQRRSMSIGGSMDNPTSSHTSIP